MRVKSIEVVFTWEDGTTHEVSSYLPAQTSSDLEQFADYWEEEYSKDEEKELTE